MIFNYVTISLSLPHPILSCQFMLCTHYLRMQSIYLYNIIEQIFISHKALYLKLNTKELLYCILYLCTSFGYYCFTQDFIQSHALLQYFRHHWQVSQMCVHFICEYQCMTCILYKLQYIVIVYPHFYICTYLYALVVCIYHTYDLTFVCISQYCNNIYLMYCIGSQ